MEVDVVGVASANVAEDVLESCATWFDNKPPSPEPDDPEPFDGLEPVPEPEPPGQPRTTPRSPHVVVVVVVGFGTVVVVVVVVDDVLFGDGDA